MSALEDQLLLYIRAAGHPMPEREFRFHPTRKWRADLAWPTRKLLVECEGGTFIRGRHSRPIGMRNDCEKYNTAALDGWTVLRFTSDMVKSGEAFETIERALRG